MGDSLSLQVVEKFGGPKKLRSFGRMRAKRWAAKIKYYPEKEPLLIECMFDVIATQCVMVKEDATIETIIRKMAGGIRAVSEEKAALDRLIETKLRGAGMLDALTSIAGIGPHYAAVIISEIGDISRFLSESHLASYAGVAPVKKESGAKKNKIAGGTVSSTAHNDQECARNNELPPPQMNSAHAEALAR